MFKYYRLDLLKEIAIGLNQSFQTISESLFSLSSCLFV